MNIYFGLSGWPILERLGSTHFLHGALAVIALAGLADGLGNQGVVLLINCITPKRFVLNLLLSVALYVASAVVWIGSLWLIAVVLFHAPVSFLSVIVAVSVAYVPLCYSALVLLPYIGPPINTLLHLWSLAMVLSVLDLVYNWGVWQSLVCAALGWLLLGGLRIALRRPTQPLGHWLWRVTTGIDTHLLPADLLVALSLDNSDNAR